MIVVFNKSRKSNQSHSWIYQTSRQRLILSIAFASAIQFLLVTMLPGWIAAAYILGKGEFAETKLGNEIWGIVMIITNILFYTPIFYLLLGWFQDFQFRKANNNSELTSITLN